KPPEMVLGTHDKRQIIEEPCEVKVSCTVLKTNGVGDNSVEFNLIKQAKQFIKLNMGCCPII
ncbi:hypothetical protein LC586_16425, partial [Nostoc sp. CHAB 5714]